MTQRPKFFMPNWKSGGQLPAHEAEKVWRAERAEAEAEIGQSILARRVYRLRYVRGGREGEAVVGEPDPFGAGDCVIAIFALSDGYLICSRRQGDRWGRWSMNVDADEVRSVESFNG